MKDMLKYKGYYGSIHFDENDLMLFGKVEFIKALISYEGESAVEIKHAFEEAIDDYLLICEKERLLPEKTFKGTFNVRIVHLTGEHYHFSPTKQLKLGNVPEVFLFHLLYK